MILRLNKAGAHKAKPERSFLFRVSNLARKIDLFVSKHVLRAWLRQLS